MRSEQLLNGPRRDSVCYAAAETLTVTESVIDLRARITKDKQRADEAPAVDFGNLRREDGLRWRDLMLGRGGFAKPSIHPGEQPGKLGMGVAGKLTRRDRERQLQTLSRAPNQPTSRVGVRGARTRRPRTPGQSTRRAGLQHGREWSRPAYYHALLTRRAFPRAYIPVLLPLRLLKGLLT